MHGHKVYSLPHRQWVDGGEITHLMTDRSIGPDEYFDRCVNFFPAVVAPIDPAEVTGIRKMDGWMPDPQGTTTLKAFAMNKMRAAAVWPARTPERLKSAPIIPTDVLPPKVSGVPLLARWQCQGQSIFDGHRFFYYQPDILKRDAYPTQEVIGLGIHGDTMFQEGYNSRYISLLTATADEALVGGYFGNPANPGPSWATAWYDMRDLDHDTFTRHIDGQWRRVTVQKALAEHCPQGNIPANCVVAMPTWMAHKAGGLDAPPPEDLPLNNPETGQPHRAYIGHAILVCPPGSARRIR